MNLLNVKKNLLIVPLVLKEFQSLIIFELKLFMFFMKVGRNIETKRNFDDFKNCLEMVLLEVYLSCSWGCWLSHEKDVKQIWEWSLQFTFNTEKLWNEYFYFWCVEIVVLNFFLVILLQVWKKSVSAFCADNDSSLWPMIVPGYLILTFDRIFTPGPL